MTLANVHAFTADTDSRHDQQGILAMSKRLPVQEYIPEQTLQHYLDDLLQDAAVALQETIEPPPLAEPAVTVKEPEQRVAEPAELAEPDVASVPVVIANETWRESEFEALLFDVGGLTLAVPLVSLGSIYPLDSEITPLFGQPDWFLGILKTPAGNLKVLDTARWVMPERYRDELKDSLQFVISVEGFDWGMAVHNVSQSIRLTPEQVKWRSQQGKRPWLAGTVIEHMCALLDVAALAQLISQHGQQTGGDKPMPAH
ncbi:MAG: chemotaxis protein CheW [Pseudomonadaceae bacterium]|nr:MAG: chemotaxis protein CheW [Pseudomonadaceae bacterium]